MGELDAPVAPRANEGALLQAGQQQFRLPVDSGASANHGLIVVADAPGKAERRREVVVVIVCWTQIAAIQRTQECRLIQITVHQRAFKLPAQSIVEREFRGYSPGVLRVETVAVVLLGLVYVVGRRLAWIPHAHHTARKREPQQVGVSADRRRKVEQRQKLRRYHSPDVLRRECHCAGGIAVAPEARA